MPKILAKYKRFFNVLEIQVVHPSADGSKDKVVPGPLEFEKYTCEGLLRTLRMFGTVPFVLTKYLM